jgi:hypothetical protein
MTRIVAVHGIGQQLEGPESQAAHWRTPLADGIALAGGVRAKPDDVRVAFYGDLFRRPGKKKAFGAAEPTIADVTNPYDQELLVEWAATVAEIEDLPDQDKLRTPQPLQRAFDVALHSKFFAGLAGRAVIWNLDQVRSYFTQPDMRVAIQERVEAAVEPDTRVIVGHSLGSVIAYEALAAHPEWPVTTLVTLGSPLGTRRLVFDRLVPAPRDERGQWPGSISAWTNVSDAGDAVAIVKRLAPLFGDRIVDISVHNGAKAHDVRPYLTAAETGRAIAAALDGAS